MLLAAVDPSLAPLLHLGEIVDRGVCPDDVHARLDEKCLDSGDLPLTEKWLKDVHSAWAEAKLAEDKYPLNERRASRSPKKAVQSLDTTIRALLIPPVILGTRHDLPVVAGTRSLTPLTKAQYAVVKALVEAGHKYVSKDDLVRLSGHGDAVNLLKKLCDQSPLWSKVIALPKIKGRGYRISA